METNFANKLKELRKAKNISQEKLANYLGVSYQAVSKWENSVTCPDIFLLPEIARYFDITVDELLQVEKIEADKYFEECSVKAEKLFRDGRVAEIIPVWLEAYKKLPNDIRVKEMLMSTYFDTDAVKYQNEIIELGTEIYNSECNNYYKDQAVSEVARTYYINGNHHKADEWARKAHQINQCQEMLFMQVHDEEDLLVETFGFANHWFLENVFYMAMRLNMCNVKCYGVDYCYKVNNAVAAVFEVAYPDDDMGYESLQQLCTLHRCIAEDAVSLGKEEAVVKEHLTRAVECAIKSVNVKSHTLKHPLVCRWNIADAPSENMQIVRAVSAELNWDCFDAYKQKDWFLELTQKLINAQQGV